MHRALMLLLAPCFTGAAAAMGMVAILPVVLPNAAMRRSCWLPSDPRRGAWRGGHRAGTGGYFWRHRLAISGVPYATLLTVVMILSVFGSVSRYIKIPAIIWLYWTGDTTWGNQSAGLERRRRHLDNVIFARYHPLPIYRCF